MGEALQSRVGGNKGLIITVDTRMVLNGQGVMQTPVLACFQPLGELPAGSRERARAKIEEQFHMAETGGTLRGSLVARCQAPFTTPSEFTEVLEALGHTQGYMVAVIDAFIVRSKKPLGFDFKVRPVADVGRNAVVSNDPFVVGNMFTHTSHLDTAIGNIRRLRLRIMHSMGVTDEGTRMALIDLAIICPPIE